MKMMWNINFIVKKTTTLEKGYTPNAETFL